MYKCWRCRENTDIKYGNGMCWDCFDLCSTASEINNEVCGEHSDEIDAEDDYKQRMKQGGV